MASLTVGVRARGGYREVRSILVLAGGTRDEDVDSDQRWEPELSAIPTIRGTSGPRRRPRPLR